jgi:hypothetical protein
MKQQCGLEIKRKKKVKTLKHEIHSKYLFSSRCLINKGEILYKVRKDEILYKARSKQTKGDNSIIFRISGMSHTIEFFAFDNTDANPKPLTIQYLIFSDIIA